MTLQIPEIFFSPTFSLADPALFTRLLTPPTEGPDAPQTPGTLETSQAGQQDLFTSYLEIIEGELLCQIRAR